MESNEEVVWDDEILAWEDKRTGRVIAPRLDSDGWDVFFVRNRNDEHAIARYCTGERYWAFARFRDEDEEREFRDVVQKILKKKPQNRVESEAKEALYGLPRSFLEG
jgi:hypothetical protein